MGWLRHVIIDIAITVLIGVATFGGQVWAAWLVWFYTPLMVLLKLGAYTAKIPQKPSEVPDWFFHVMYAANLVMLLYHAWYWVAAGWVAIWILSVMIAARSRPKSGS